MSRLLFFFQTDCPTCQLISPYLNRAAEQGVSIAGVSQDDEAATQAFTSAMAIRFPVEIDRDLRLSRQYDPVAVPTVLLLDDQDAVVQSCTGFDKTALNTLAATMGVAPIARPDDGAPPSKPGCMSRHREGAVDGERATLLDLYAARGAAATRIEVSDDDDLDEYCAREFGDPLPVVPPTEARVARMLAACDLDPLEVIGRIAPNYGAATVEKIAANAVMAGCPPEMMRVLVPLVRAACDERFNLHGVQATTHFAAPLIIVNGPIRQELGFWSRQNVFSNVARANSTLGRAFQLILRNLGGALPDTIDMSTLGNPGKFSFCIAENEEENPWQPLHADNGCARGVERRHALRRRAAARCQRTHRAHAHRCWPRRCRPRSPPRGATDRASAAKRSSCCARSTSRPSIATAGARNSSASFSSITPACRSAPTNANDGGEGTQHAASYAEVEIDGERCYRKFTSPSAIHLVVAGGTAGKFSAVIGSWSTGPRGSQMVTYRCGVIGAAR